MTGVQTCALPIYKRLSSELGVPVVDGVPAAVKLLEGLFSCGIQTSKQRAYSRLDMKEIVNLPAIFSEPYNQD